MAIKVVCAPDSFKGSISAVDAALAMEEGVKKYLPSAIVEKIPLSDGGEGLVETLLASAGGTSQVIKVTDPLGEPIWSEYGILNDKKTAVMEMAAASGLPLIPREKRNPLKTTTTGTGELVKNALDKGCSRIIMGIGGSATNDGGMGMASALGIRIFDAEGNLLAGKGEDLIKIKRIDLEELDPRIKKVKIQVACDVNNPLTGPEGAARVYGPQKGASEEMVEVLERGLKNLAEIIKKQYNLDVEDVPGAGAAGGLGAALLAFFGGELQPGTDLVLQAVSFSERIEGAQLILTGEGKLDKQTAHGKVIAGVSREAGKKGIPVVALAGTIEDAEYLHDKLELNAYYPIVNRPMSLDEAVENAFDLIREAAQQVVRIFFCS